ncbi:polypyrimidine tract-binding protein homolog 2 isoform X1, partial [Tanacetum coccineum]
MISVLSRVVMFFLNALVKIIAKYEFKGSLMHLISPNQSAFVPGRSIADNILLTHELMHNYHLDRGVARCAFKVDIQKAYDTVDWGFLKSVTIWYRGLRQGDPLSPYLFTMVMEVLTLILRRKIRNSDDFRYHRFCEDLELINLCFADDLFLFSHGDDKSAKVIMEALNEFKFASGLVPSLPKSTAYFCNVLNYTKIAILQIMPFEEGSLPVKYLGVPLVPSRLVYKDCKELIEKVEGRINDWKNKSLSIAGKMRKGKSKVAWEDVCLPKNEGGLGVKRLDIFNKALMSSHIWKLLIRKDSCGPKWIHTYKLRNRNFGTFHFRGSRHGTVEKKSYNCVPVIREFNWDLHRVGLTTMSKVRDIIHDGSLSWPADLEFLRFGRLLDREMLRRLKTQDMLRSWDLSSSLNAGSCLLCSSQPDSHEHLFFECTRTSMSIVTKLILAASTYFIWQERNERLFNNQHRSANQVNKARVVMSSASSAVTYTSVYTDSEPGRVFWGADEEISDGGSPRVIVYGYDGLPMQPVAPPSPDYIPGPEDPQTPPVPQDEDEREAMFIQPHDPDYVPEPIYPEYIPLEDEHVFPVEEQPLPPVDSPTAESPGYVTESDPEEDPEEYEDDETEDGPVDYPIDEGDDGDDDDGDSSIFSYFHP